MPRESSPKRRKTATAASGDAAELPLAELLSDRTLRGLTDPKSYERGKGYAAEGRVVSLTHYRGELLAVLQALRGGGAGRREASRGGAIAR